MPKRNPEPERLRRVRRAAVLLVGLATALAASAISAAGFDLAQLTAQLARVKSGEATFTEKRRVEMLDRTLESSGRLVFRAPDRSIVEGFARKDPYVVHGVVVRWEVRPWTVVVGNEPDEGSAGGVP
jgi:hypothetical protein